MVNQLFDQSVQAMTFYASYFSMVAQHPNLLSLGLQMGVDGLLASTMQPPWQSLDFLQDLNASLNPFTQVNVPIKPCLMYLPPDALHCLPASEFWASVLADDAARRELAETNKAAIKRVSFILSLNYTVSCNNLNLKENLINSLIINYT